MRRILLREKGGGQWHEVGEAAFRNEAHLQALLHENPRLIPFSDLGEGYPEPRVFVREAGLPGSGNTDLIGVDEQGRITIIECKLATNQEQKRKVVGQVLEYAAFLWQMSYEQFERLFARQYEGAGKPGLAGLVAPAIEQSDWSEEDFRASVESTLAQGDFLLVIAVDSLNPELRRIIEYLNRKGGNGAMICAAEVDYFASEQHEVLAPRLVGPKQQPPPPPLGWDEPRFFAAAEGRCTSEAVSTMRALYTFAKTASDNCKWGRGKDGSFTFRLERGRVTGSVFSVFTSGDLSVNLGYIDDKVPAEVVSRFVEEVSRIPAFSDLPARALERRWVHYPVTTLAAEGDRQAFEAAVLRVRDSATGE